MTNQTLIPVYTAILLILASLAFAISNPASTYCVEQGYKNEIKIDENGGQYGVCVFTDGTSCEEWKFFRGECELAKKEAPCKKEGEPVPVTPSAPQCCSGLKLLKPKNFPFTGIAGICSAKCGNGACDKNTESEINCPLDCAKCKKEGQFAVDIPGTPKCCSGLKLLKPRVFSTKSASGVCTAKCGDGKCDAKTESAYNCPEDCATCKKEGEMIPNMRSNARDPPKCCKGLNIVPPKEPLLGITGYCSSKCGNGICDSKIENARNCQRDCKK